GAMGYSILKGRLVYPVELGPCCRKISDHVVWRGRQAPVRVSFDRIRPIPFCRDPARQARGPRPRATTALIGLISFCRTVLSPEHDTLFPNVILHIETVGDHPQHVCQLRPFETSGEVAVECLRGFYND